MFTRWDNGRDEPLGHPPVLVQLRVVDQHMTTAQHVMQLRHLQAVTLEVGDDRRFLRAQPGRCRQQPLAVLPARAVIWIIRRTRVRTSSVCPAVRPLAGTRPGCSAAIRLSRREPPA